MPVTAGSTSGESYGQARLVTWFRRGCGPMVNLVNPLQVFGYHCSGAASAPPVGVVPAVGPVRGRGSWLPSAGSALVVCLAAVALWLVGSALAPTFAVPALLAALAFVSLPAFALGGRGLAAVRRVRQGVDELTGLPGRRYFVESGRRWLAGGEHRAGGPAGSALLLIDIDRLRDVNATLGHEHGDRMLATVGWRLRSVVGPTGLVARVDGDEFAVLLRGTDLASAEKAASRARAAVRVPVSLDDVRVQAEVSVGIAHAPEHGRGMLELLRRAEEAMYVAKATKCGQRVFDDRCRIASRAGLELRADLRGALDGGQIELRYQPKVDLRSSRVSGLEALVRWRHPAHGLRPPQVFLAEMERAGLMPRLTRQVLDLALADCARWHEAGVPLTVSVNAPASVIIDSGFVDEVLAALRLRHLPPSALVIEVTEEGLITVLETAQRTLAGLRENGVRVSLDDYGTGFCSLAYLRELPADEVKLDRMFLRDIDRDASAAEIVRSTVSLAHALRLRIVAEGVESQRSLTSLARWQCDEAQGYFVSRPLSADRVLGWMQEWNDRMGRIAEAGARVATSPSLSVLGSGTDGHPVVNDPVPGGPESGGPESGRCGGRPGGPLRAVESVGTADTTGDIQDSGQRRVSALVPGARPRLWSEGFHMSQHVDIGSRAQARLTRAIR